MLIYKGEMFSVYKYSNNLKDDGVIITDNIAFHGLVEQEERIKNKIIEAMDKCGLEENSPEESKTKFAEAIAEAVIFEIKNMTITATAPNGAVTIIKIE